MAMLGLVVTVGYDYGCVGGGLNKYFFLVMCYGCHMEVVASKVVVEVVVAGWKVFVVYILYFIFYFNEFFILF